MNLATGTRLGPYEILSPLGAGGMGEVYRARDTPLGREVAVKVLPAAFSENAEKLARFEQGARAAGVLNHPNILAIRGKRKGEPQAIAPLSLHAGFSLCRKHARTDRIRISVHDLEAPERQAN